MFSLSFPFKQAKNSSTNKDDLEGEIGCFLLILNHYDLWIIMEYG